jgi:Uma2 family endonuclease
MTTKQSERKKAAVPATAVSQPTIEDEDPYPFGWRDVRHTLPDGQKVWKREPLTLYDILHPQIGDFRMQSDSHERFCNYLYNVFTAQVANDPTAVVLHDTRVAWDVPGLEPHGPDIAVIFNVREHKDWKTFDVKKEGTRPSVIVEITSPKTRSVDLVDKVDEYEQAGVPYYLLVDAVTRQGEPVRRLRGYQLVGGEYTYLAPDGYGRLWIEPLRLWLGLQDNEVMCYDEAGQPLANYKEVVRLAAKAEQRAAKAEARATAEAQARQQAEKELEKLRAELDKLRGGD